MNYFSSAAAKVAATANAAIVAGAEVAKTTSNSVQHLVDEKYGVSETKCTKCGAVSKGGISNLAVNISKGQLHNFQRCLVCDRQYCPLCISRSRYKIPGNRLHKNSESKKSDALPVRGWCCCDCEEPLIDIWKRDFKSTIGRLFDMNVMTFLSLVGRGPLDYKAVAYSFFRMPKGEGGTMKERGRRDDMRKLQAVELTLDALVWAPIATYAQLALTAFHGSIAVLGIIDNDVAEFLTIIWGVLDEMGFTVEGGEKGVSHTKKKVNDRAVELMRLYYVGCDHERVKKINPSLELSLHNAGDPGVLASVCPSNIFEYVGKYVGPAAWLYNSILPKPHEDSRWSGWYLSQIIVRDTVHSTDTSGWVLLACVNETTVLPDGTKCPGFALAVRDYINTSEVSDSRGEVLLAVRGSVSVNDWFINIDEKPVDFNYYQGSFKSVVSEGLYECSKRSVEEIASECKPNEEAEYKKISCQVHRGMYRAALGILDQFGMRNHIKNLRGAGYHDIKVVGHSLGAGVCSMLVAILKNDLVTEWLESPEANSIYKPVCGIAFATPACVDTKLADALLIDNVLATVVHRDDVIPRLSRRNFRKLANKLYEQEMEEKSTKWGTRDYQDAKHWIQNIGKAKVIAAGGNEDDVIRVSMSDVNIEEIDARKYNTVMEPEDYYSESDYYETQANVSEDMEANYAATAPPVAVAAATHDFVSDSNSASIKFPTPENELWFVVPGKIIHLVKDDSRWSPANAHRATYSATLADYRLAALREITPILAGVEQHTMRQYTNAMRATRIGYIRLHSDACRPSKRFANSIIKPIQTPGEGQFNCCGVCNVDGAWPYVLQSDATRSITMDHCRVCGCLTCGFCAPSGQELRGDGLKSVIKLPDFRIVLPLSYYDSMDPQRVCRTCFMNSFDIV